MSETIGNKQNKSGFTLFTQNVCYVFPVMFKGNIIERFIEKNILVMNCTIFNIFSSISLCIKNKSFACMLCVNSVYVRVCACVRAHLGIITQCVACGIAKQTI
jgi:hypothetical protein